MCKNVRHTSHALKQVAMETTLFIFMCIEKKYGDVV